MLSPTQIRTGNIRKSTESVEATIDITNSDQDDDDDQKSQTAVMMLSSDEDGDGYETPTGEIKEVNFGRSKTDEGKEMSDSDCETTNKMISSSRRPETSPCGSKSNLSGWESDLSVKHSISALETQKAFSEYDRNLLEENAKLRAQVEILLNGGDETVRILFEENRKLKSQLTEANDYVDHADIENEQQYSSMSSQIEDLCQLVGVKNKDIFKLRKEMEEKDALLSKLGSSCEQLKTSNNRQKEIIESLREELDRERELHQETANEKERLICEVSELQRKIDSDRGEFTEKELLMQIELEDVQRSLDKQKEILSSSTVANLVDKWERRVLSLENAIRERDVMLHTQQQIINEMRRRQSLLDRSHASSGESLNSSERSLIEGRKKQALIKYLTSDDSDKRELLDTVAVALDLTRDEEDYLRNSLSRNKRNRRQFIM